MGRNGGPAWTGIRTQYMTATSKSMSAPAIVEYIKGKLHRIRVEETSSIEVTTTTTGTGSFTETSTGCPYDTLYFQRSELSRSQRESSNHTTVLEDGPVTVSGFHSVSSSSFRQSSQTIHYTDPNGGSARAGCVGFTPEPMQTSSGENPSVSISEISGTSAIISFTGDAGGTVFSDAAQGSATMRFRELPLPVAGAPIIGDAAPTGEVFAARSDKSFVFYEPLRGSGMPGQITLPSNMVLLIGAIWN